VYTKKVSSNGKNQVKFCQLCLNYGLPAMNLSHYFRLFLHYLNLEPELEDFGNTDATIRKDIVFKGTNLWILIFAIMVASVGLNMNSTAVIIGAMLISPLMGPIIGVGYSIATYNFPLLSKALKNFSFAIIASLVTSTLYFTLTPVSSAHSELLARTSPTIYDVLIAFFGGLAGIVALSSKQKGNVIPGVAIATALMPPLCTAGYGLATLQVKFLFGALYLFFINSVFIAFAALLVSQLLKFPITTIIDPHLRNRINRFITVIIVVTLIPSIYFGYKLVQKEKFISGANEYLKSVSYYEGNYLLRHEINPEKKTLVLVYGGGTLSEAAKKHLTGLAENFGLEKASVEIETALQMDEPVKNREESERMNTEVQPLQVMVQRYKSQYDALSKVPDTGKKLLGEARAIFPELKSCSYAETRMYTSQGTEGKDISVVVFGYRGRLDKDAQEKIHAWLVERLGRANVKTVFEREE